jgi:hypothetical protein
VSTGSTDGLWGRFEHDPRDPAYAGMRASDRDRAVVHDALAEAYAEGRIDRDELDERSSQVEAAKTYGALVTPLSDLAVDAAVPAVSRESRAELERQARAKYREELGEAFMGVLIPNLICWAIWWMTGHDGFVWPVFVLIPTVGNFIRVLASRQAMVERRVDKLERRQARALETPKPPTSSSRTSEPRPVRHDQERSEEA